jgi:hypothetical protein
MSHSLSAKYGVFVPGRGLAEEPVVQALSSAIGTSPVDARMILASRIPRRVLSTPTAEEADDRVRTLRGAGFQAFAESFESLRARPVVARTARWDAEGLAFEPGLRFPPQDGIRLIVRGRIVSGQTVKTTVSGRTKYGGLAPVGASFDQAGTSEQFVHFYGASPEIAVGIRPQAFNFRFLGPDAGSTKAGALKALLGKIQAQWPEVRIDETLLHYTPASEEVGSTDSFDAGALGAVETNRRTDSNEGGVLRAALLLAILALRPDFS